MCIYTHAVIEVTEEWTSKVNGINTSKRFIKQYNTCNNMDQFVWFIKLAQINIVYL